MKFFPLPLAGAFRIELEPLGDRRGFLARTFCVDEFARAGLETRWPQHNITFTATRGTLRGMHFQRPPMAEVKLITCIVGAVWDVIVDLRAGSPTFGQWHAARLDRQSRDMLYVPKGLAHGFQALTDGVEMLYLHSEPYSQDHEGGLIWNDADVGIDWPLEVSEISPRDLAFQGLRDLEPIET